MNGFFVKDEDYSIPSDSPYMSFEEGDNKFRILGSFAEKTAVQGIEYWKTIGDKRKPVRVKPGVNIPVSELEINPRDGKLETPSYFWALPVWNYKDKKIQILKIKQKTVLGPMKKVIENPKWGDPRDYDFIVTQSKEGQKTVYTVTNDPKESLPADIIERYTSMTINMQAYMESGDPFAKVEPPIDNDEVDKGIEEQRKAEAKS